MDDGITPKEKTKPNPLKKIFGYFLEHPAIGGSCVYIVLSAIGVIYSWSLYRKFQINIFDYAEANDFLLIAFKQPGTFAIVLLTILSITIIRYSENL